MKSLLKTVPSVRAEEFSLWLSTGLLKLKEISRRLKLTEKESRFGAVTSGRNSLHGSSSVGRIGIWNVAPVILLVVLVSLAKSDVHDKKQELADLHKYTLVLILIESSLESWIVKEFRLDDPTKEPLLN